MALDGSDSIGANSYFLKLGQTNILLDCGSSGPANNFHGANLCPLYEAGLISSPLDISQIYISHAHMDHMGYLPQMMEHHRCSPVMEEALPAFGDLKQLN